MPLMKFGRLYKLLVKHYPVMIQTFETGMLMGSGDIIAQTVVEEKSFKQLEFIRTLRFFGIGVCLVGPSSALWYKFLSKNLGDGGKSVALKKVALDQLVFAPISAVIFLAVLNKLKGGDLEQLKKELNAKYVDIMLNNYKFWPAVQIVNFYLVPLRYQVLLVQSVGLFWNTYMSWKTQQQV